MTQNWGPPDYPPPPQYQQSPQYQLPEPETDYYYYETEGDTTAKRTLIFLAGSCVTLFIVGCCFFALAAAWIIDERFGITASGTPEISTVVPQEQVFTPPQPVPPAPLPAEATVEPTPLPTSTPQPTSTPETSPTPAPGVIGQPVSDSNAALELVVLDFQRNVQPNNLAPAQGMEFVSVSVQLSLTEEAEADVDYEVTEFQLQNGQGVIYDADPEAENGRRLPGGEVTAEGPVEGDLFFHIPMGDAPLFLLWGPPESDQIYTIVLQ